MAGSEQPLIEHLAELRGRLLRIVLAVLLVFLSLIPFANRLYTIVAQPLLAQLPAGSSMIAIDVASPFLTPFKLALVLALFICMPWVIFQLWAFVAPGLYQREKRLAMPLMVSSALLFYVGCAFCYFIVMPMAFFFLTHTAPEGVAMMTDINRYLDFVLVMMMAFGIAFEVPIVVIILVALGVVTREQLAQKRPYIIVGAFCIGMFLTPPDAISQLALALPMWVLFEIGLVMSSVLIRKPRSHPASE